MIYRCLHTDPLPLAKAKMSNFDHSIDCDCVAALAGNQMIGYAGWNFHANVMQVGDIYIADVHQYRQHVAFIAAPTLRELMVAVSDQFGWE